MTDTDRLAELAAAATPGPWLYDEVSGWSIWNAAGERMYDADHATVADAAFIRSLVDDNRELRAAAEAVDELWYLDKGIVRFVDPQHDAFVALTRFRAALIASDHKP